MKIFPRINFLRKFYNKDVELAALDQEIAAAENLPDAGERLLRYDALAREANELSFKGILSSTIPGGLAVLGGVVMVVGGLATLNAPFVAGGIALLYSTISVVRELGADGEEAAWARFDKCWKAREDLVNNTDPKLFAPSPVFEKIMAFSDLRQKFVLAAAREKFMPAEVLAARYAGGSPSP